MKITKAVIPAAGLGTRVLPASKTVPKEMLNIVDKPAIQYLVEECAQAGITDILVITNRGKGIIEDHFDYSVEVENALRGNESKKALYDSVHAAANLANMYYVRQKETKGLAHAILAAEAFVGNEPFAILYGDDITYSDSKPVIGQLIDAYNRYGKNATGVKAVPDELVMKYCTLDVTPLEGNIYDVHHIIEKPKKEEILSNFSVLGRNVVSPEIFDLIRQTPPSASGEVYFSDTLSHLAENNLLVAVDFDGRRFDMGSKFGIMEANVEMALRHPEIGKEFKEYLKELAKTL